MSSLSAWGLPTPVVVLACIGNVDIQVFFWYRWVTLFCTAFAGLHSLGGGGFFRKVNLLGQSCRNRPAEFARCPRCPPRACQRRLLTLLVSVMLIFKHFSYVSGQPYFVRRLQAGGGILSYTRHSKQTISQGVTLLFFFAEKKKRSKKRKEFAFHLYYKVKYHPKITQRISH